MTIQNRDAFLNNIAANLGRIRRTTGVVRPKWSVTPQQDVFKDHTPDELVQELKNICKEIHTDVKQTTNKELAKTLKTTIDEYKGKTIIASSDKRNETFGLDDFYARLSKDYNVHLWDANHGIENQKVAERADIGITFSDLTLAESGTVVLWNNETNGRSISLLPRIYI